MDNQPPVRTIGTRYDADGHRVTFGVSFGQVTISIDDEPALRFDSADGIPELLAQADTAAAADMAGFQAAFGAVVTDPSEIPL